MSVETALGVSPEETGPNERPQVPPQPVNKRAAAQQRRRQRERSGASMPPSVDELKAQAGEPEREPDAEPGTHRPRKIRKSASAGATPAMPRAGTLARAVNKLYARAGRFVRAVDPVLGNAIIGATRAESEDDQTVGEAWEELARTNPRIRAVLLTLIQGNAWWGLFAAHLPIVMAVLMKESVRARIPFGSFLDVFDEQDDENPAPGGLGDLLGGMSQEDMAMAMQFAQAQFGRMITGVPRETVVIDGGEPGPS